MSFLSGLLDIGKSAVSFLSGNSLMSGLARTAILAYGVNRLSQNANKGSDAGTTPNIDYGVRLQRKPSAQNSIPVLYGSAYTGGALIDVQPADISNKAMWFAVVLSEKTGTVYSTSTASANTLNAVYWNNQEIVFQSDGVTVDYTKDNTTLNAGGTPYTDSSLQGLVKIYFYDGSSTDGKLPDGFSGSISDAYDLMPNWTSSANAMDGLVFALIRVEYNKERSVTDLGDVKFKISNSLYSPGDVVYDYLTSSTYGAQIDSSKIITADVAALNTYSQQSVTTPDGTLDDRYQINGLIDTAEPVLKNAEKILSAAASWLSYDTHEGTWGIVINKDGSSVASFDDSNIIGSISIGGTGLKDFNNAVTVEFPHRVLRDSADFWKIELPKLNTNEERKYLDLKYDIINDPYQAQILGFIELKQTRLDRMIKFTTDFSYYNLKAGDIIDITNDRFGFTNDLYRIMSITETQDDSGALTMSIDALQYDADVYNLDDIESFTRTLNDNIVTIGQLGQPSKPDVDVTTFAQDARPRIVISTTAPSGRVEALEFWLAESSTPTTYRLIATTYPSIGGLYTSGDAVNVIYDSISSLSFYVKVRAINSTTVGPFSATSDYKEFVPIQTTNAIDANTQMYDSTGGLLTGLLLVQLAGKLLDLFGGDTSKSIFQKIFDTFTDETGFDLLGSASGGSLVAPAELETKADGTTVSATTASYDFIGPIEASGTTDVEIKLKDGTTNKDILAWNADAGEWQTISGCITCDFPTPPDPPTPAVPCSLEVAATLPSSASSGFSLCPTTTTVPYTGSYFIKFSINPGSAEGGDPNPSIDLVAPLVKGTGSFKLYGTDGKLEQTVAIGSCNIWNDVVEIPLAARAPGKDYYIIWDEGIVTNCSCENIAVDDATTWRFTTSETPQSDYKLSDIGVTDIPQGESSTDERTSPITDIAFTVSPSATVCSNSQELVLTFASKVIKGTGSVTLVARDTGTTIQSFPVGSATLSADGKTANFGAIPTLTADKYYDFLAPRGLFLTESVAGTSSYCDKTTAIAAPPQRKSRETSWGIKADVALRVTSVEFCQLDNGKCALRSNIKINFNKSISVKASSPAEITIKSGLFGITFQKIDLRGTYQSGKFGSLDSIGDDYIIVNPTKMFDSNSSYYINIPSGVIIDADCEAAFEVTDSSTIAWQTDGAAPTPPQGLTYGSVLFDMKYDRPVLPGYAKMNIVAADGRLLTQINSTDLAVKWSYNEPFED